MFSCTWASCRLCPLNLQAKNLHSPRMLPTAGRGFTNKYPIIYILGEAPGAEEDLQGQQFVGPAGQLLREAIPDWAESHLIWDNAVRCRPTEKSDYDRLKNRTPTAREFATCLGYTPGFIEVAKPAAILGLGATALHTVWFDGRITELRGIWLATSWNIPFYASYHPSYVLHAGTDKPEATVFRTDIARFFEQVKLGKIPQFDLFLPPYDTGFEYASPASAAELWCLLDAAFRGSYALALDLETTTLRPYEPNARVYTVAISDGDKTLAFAVPEVQEIDFLATIVNFYKNRLFIAHNAQFELTWFEYKVPGSLKLLGNNFFDTMLTIRVAHSRKDTMSLANATQIYLGVNVKELQPIDVRRLMEFPLSAILKYNAFDAKATFLLSRSQSNDFEFFDQDQINEVEKLHRVLPWQIASELRGVPINPVQVHKLKDDNQRELQEIVANTIAMPEVRQFEAQYGVKLSLSAPQQIGRVLTEFCGLSLPKTKKGSNSTGADILETLDHDLARNILAYRRLEKLRSTYIDPLLVSHNGSSIEFIHPNYSHVFTDSGRSSSRDPNIQNFPKRRDKTVRSVVEASEGKYLLAGDYRQLEARVIAMKTRDENLIQEITNKIDIHGNWCREVVNRYPAYVDHCLLAARAKKANPEADFAIARDTIKNEMVFALFYGSVAEACQSRMDVPLEILSEVVDLFWGRYSGVKASIENDYKVYDHTGFTRCLTYRKRGGILSANQCVNTPIQGTAADLVREVKIRLYNLAIELNDPELLPRIEVHDELVFEVSEHRLDSVAEIVMTEMVKARFPFVIVPLAVTLSVGKNWASMEKLGDVEGKIWQ